MAEIKSDTLATLLASLDTTYVIRFNLDGSWEVLDSYSFVVYRGHQKEVYAWLKRQPLA